MGGASWVGKTGLNLLEGALPGAAIGALTNPDEPWKGAVLGGAFGGAGGAASGISTRFLKMALPSLASHLFANQLSPKRVRGLGLNELNSVLHNDGLTTDLLRSELSRLGPGATLADAGDENMLARAASVATTPSPERRLALGALRERAAGRPQRVLDLVQRYLTPNLNADAAFKTLQDQQSADAEAMYKDALQPGGQDVPVASPPLHSILDRLNAGGAFKKATTLARVEGQPPPAPLTKPDPATNVPGRYALTGRQHDLIVRGLGDQISRAYKKGDNTLGRSLVKLKHEYLGQLYPLLPGYEDARNTFSDYATSKDAIEAGKEFNDRGWRADDLIDYYHSLNTGDQDFMRLGMGQKLGDIINGEPTNHNVIKKFFGSPTQRTKLATVFPDLPSHDAFTAALQDEMRQAVTENKLLGGSITQPKLAEAASRNAANPDMLMRVVNHPGGMWSGAATAGLESLGHDPAKLAELSAGDLTKILLNPKLHENLGLLDNLDRYNKTQRVKKMIGSILENTAATAGGAGAGAVASLVGAPPAAAAEPAPAAPDPGLPPEPPMYSGGGRVYPARPSQPAGLPEGEPRAGSVESSPYDDPDALNDYLSVMGQPALHAPDFNHPYTSNNDIHIYNDLPSREPGNELPLGPYVRGQEPRLVNRNRWLGAETYQGPNGERADVDASNFVLPFTDELDAALGTAGDWLHGRSDSGTYDRRLKLMRGAMEKYQGRNPVTAGAASLLGVLPGGEAAPAKIASMVMRSPLARKLLQGALGGAFYGGVYGFDEGEGGLANRLKKAGSWASMGALAGGAMQPKGYLKGAGKALSRLVEMGLE